MSEDGKWVLTVMIILSNVLFILWAAVTYVKGVNCVPIVTALSTRAAMKATKAKQEAKEAAEEAEFQR